jgi:hypothetical protein
MLACKRTAALVFPAVSLRANCFLRLAVAAATPRGRAVRYSQRLAPNAAKQKSTSISLRYIPLLFYDCAQGCFTCHFCHISILAIWIFRQFCVFFKVLKFLFKSVLFPPKKRICKVSNSAYRL